MQAAARATTVEGRIGGRASIAVILRLTPSPAPRGAGATQGAGIWRRRMVPFAPTAQRSFGEAPQIDST